MSQNQILSGALDWSLRALAQNANTQRELYPQFVLVPNELALDFDDALKAEPQQFCGLNPDLVALDILFDSKSGRAEYWTDDALEQSEFWAEIRLLAKQALENRELSVAAPNTTASKYIHGSDVFGTFYNSASKFLSLSTIVSSKFGKLFR